MSEQKANLYLAMVANVRNVMMYQAGIQNFLVTPMVFFVTSQEAIEAMCLELGIEMGTDPCTGCVEIGPISMQVTPALSGLVAYVIPNPHRACRTFMEREWLL